MTGKGKHMIISAYKQNDYGIENVQKTANKIFDDLGGIEKFVQKGTKVLIKPNLLAKRAPERATTTHPAVVEAIAKAVIAAGGIATIADSPGGPYSKEMLKGVYNTCGMSNAADSSGAQLNFDTGDRLVLLGGEFSDLRVNIINPVLENDIIINVAKLKTHAFTYFSGCVKNLFGAISGIYKTQYHFKYKERNQFSNMLVDLCEYIKPDISFIDGVWGMEGNGPSNGAPKHVGVLLASESPYAADFAACLAAGVDIENVDTNTNAVRRGLFEPDKMKYRGDFDVENTGINFKAPDSQMNMGNMPKFITSLAEGILSSPYPKFVKERCIACNRCVEACPAVALKMEDKIPKLTKNKCIKCYCCQEMCPHDAISLKKGLFEFINKIVR